MKPELAKRATVAAWIYILAACLGVAVASLPWLLSGQSSDRRHAGEPIQPPQENSPGAVADGLPRRSSMAGADEQRIARSEYDAAQPPPAGPGPETLVPELVGAVRFQASTASDQAFAYRLESRSPAFSAAGFRNGDLLLEVDDAPVTAGRAERGLDRELRPGATVVVERSGERVAWRIGQRAA